MGTEKKEINFKFPMGREEITKLIPHRDPFLYIDVIDGFLDAESITSTWHVSKESPFFKGHFPDYQVVPGVLLLEALAQTGAVLAQLSSYGVASKEKLIFLVGADKFRWKKQVLPGDTVNMTVKKQRYRSGLWIMEGSSIVNDKIVAEGIFSAMEQG
jgi:3-hydroxyacyl-[acyl-carrier-protein] dehydratase